MFAIVGLVMVVVVSVVVVYNYAYTYDTSKRMEKKIAAIDEKAQIADKDVKEQSLLEVNKAKAEVNVNMMNIKKEAKDNLMTEASKLRSEVNATSEKINKTVSDYVNELLGKVGQVSADQKATWNDFSQVKKDFNATKADYEKTKKDFYESQERNISSTNPNDIIALKDALAKELVTQKVSTGNLEVKNTMTTAGLTSRGGIDVVGNGPLHFGVGIEKEMNAGKIGYGVFDGNNSLNIVGAGKQGDARIVRIWDRLTVNDNITAGNLEVKGNADIKGPLKVIGEIKVCNPANPNACKTYGF